MIARILQMCGLQNAANMSHVTTFALMSPRNGVQKMAWQGWHTINKGDSIFSCFAGRGERAGAR